MFFLLHFCKLLVKFVMSCNSNQFLMKLMQRHMCKYSFPVKIKNLIIMRKRFLVFVFIVANIASTFGQAPEKFNYQAVLRSSSGELISDQSVDIEISIRDIQSDGTILYTETHTKTTNSYGLVNLFVGTGTVDLGTFSEINWAVNDKFIQVKVDAGSGLTDMGVFQLLSVPFAMHAASASNLGSDNVYAGTDTLFVVKDAEGNPVFVVFPDGVKVIVEEATKGTVGGFAVSGRSPTKAEETDIFRVTPDSTRIYVNDTIQSKGRVGGFAVSGRSPTKGTKNEYLLVTQDSTRIYVSDTTLSKGRVGGFAVSGRSPTKSGVQDYFNISGNKEVETIDSEARIFWYPNKEAFLTGRVIVESPDSVGLNSFTTGFESKAIGNYSQAMGYKSISRGDYSIAIGYNSVAGTDTSEGAFAFGYEAQALGENSFAVGDSAIATGINAVAIGSGFRNFIYEFPDGTDTVDASGPVAIADNSLAIGPGTVASGRSALAFGALSTASAPFSSTFGLRNTATEHAAMAIGGENNVASNKWSVTLGGSYNGAEGKSSIVAGGDYNFAYSDAQFSAVLGGTYNAVEGVGSVTLGGVNLTSLGDNSVIAGGNFNLSEADYSVVLGGKGLWANDYSEIVMGRYNVISTGNTTSWNSSDNILVVGNGDMSTRSNALTLQKNGDMTLAGSLTTSGLKLESDASSGYVLTSDANGNANWQAAAGGSAWTENGGYLYYNSGNVGIGIIDPSGAFEVLTTLKIAAAISSSNINGTWLDIGNLTGAYWSLISTGSGNSEGAGKLLFRDENGFNRLILSTDGNVGIGTDTPKSKLQVQGGIQVGNDSDAASADKVGTFRYREDANNSYVEVCMKTGASTYSWVIIQTNTWLTK